MLICITSPSLLLPVVISYSFYNSTLDLLKYNIYVELLPCDFFSLFSTFVVLHDLALYCFSTYCFLSFTSLVILTGFLHRGRAETFM